MTNIKQLIKLVIRVFSAVYSLSGFASSVKSIYCFYAKAYIVVINLNIKAVIYELKKYREKHDLCRRVYYDFAYKRM